MAKESNKLQKSYLLISIQNLLEKLERILVFDSIKIKNYTSSRFLSIPSHKKPLFMLRNEKELKEKLLQTPEGLREEDLKRSYHGIEEDIEVTNNQLNSLKLMIKKREAITIVDTETKQRILFPYDARYNVPVFPEFQTMWASIRVPDDVDLEKEMQRAGISMMAQTKITRKRPLPQKKTRQRRFRKVTNVHMEPIVDQ